MEGQLELYDRLVTGIHAHIEWAPATGWTLWVTGRLDGCEWGSVGSEGYGPMTFEELGTITDAVLGSLYDRSRFPGR